jgi:hypothetical protein
MTSGSAAVLAVVSSIPNQGSGRIYRMSKCGGDVVTLTPQISNYGGEAVDDRYIYYATSNQVFRIAK